MTDSRGVGYPDLTRCFLDLAANYFWPLLEEVAPKLGTYEPLVEAAYHVADFLFRMCARRRSSYILVHRDIMQRHSKVFEILEYAGFISRRDASRALKSGGRGVTFAVNLCNLLEATQGGRLTTEIAEGWLSGIVDPVELHSSNVEFADIYIPDVEVDRGGEQVELPILLKDVSTLKKSNAYPYGLTDDKINRLKDAGLERIVDVAEASDRKLLEIDYVGPRHLKRIRDVVYQAIWM